MHDKQFDAMTKRLKEAGIVGKRRQQGTIRSILVGYGFVLGADGKQHLFLFREYKGVKGMMQEGQAVTFTLIDGNQGRLIAAEVRPVCHINP